jgi:hypothetical protein
MNDTSVTDVRAMMQYSDQPRQQRKNAGAVLTGFRFAT